ncbi:MAG: 2-dehydro-3-deoxyphosphooctonate aldolase [Flavobacterium sp.]|nr:2-dehydro-3-deoxyphosphooctonate aldolase [Flavobacterium sp.]
MKNSLFIVILSLILSACTSTQSTLKNVKNDAEIPKVSAANTFILTAFSKDKKYGYDKDYPINVFYKNVAAAKENQERFLNALAGPKGEKISYTKTGICCPFPNTKSEMGVASLDIYSITWEGQKKPIILYLNSYEKGVLMVPMGFTAK